MSTTPHAGATFTFENLSYSVDVRGGRASTSSTTTKDILRDVSGAANAGEVLALMGPTGSGKTSLLNALAGRTPVGGRLRGEILVDGETRTENFMRERVAYVMQEELLFPFLTVEETLTLHCRLRRAKLTEGEVRERVDEIIGELGLVNFNSRCGRRHPRRASNLTELKCE